MKLWETHFRTWLEPTLAFVFRSVLARIPRLGLLALAGALVEVGWLLLWMTSKQARITADVDGVLTPPPLTPLERTLDALDWAAGLMPELGTLPHAAIAGTISACLVVIGCGYLAAMVLLNRRYARVPGATALVVAFAAIFQCTLLLMPGVFSTDPFSYLIYGQAAALYGVNPYVSPPSSLTSSPLLPWIFPAWQFLPSPYGPLWTRVSVLLSPALQGLDVSDQVMAFGLFMHAVHVINLVLVAWLVGRALPSGTGARLTAFAMFAWNPLVLLELTGNGHNDGLMLTFLLAGMVSISYVPTTLTAMTQKGLPRSSTNHRMRWMAGVALIGLGALVKYATLPIGMIAAVVWAGTLHGSRARVLWLGATGLLLLGVAVGLFWPWLTGPQVLFSALGEVSGQVQYHSFSTLLTRQVTDYLVIAMHTDAEQAERASVSLVSLVSRVLFMVYFAWEVRRLWMMRSIDAPLRVISTVSTRIFLVLLVLVQSEMHAWYFTWPLALVVLLGWRDIWTKIVVGYTLTALPAYYFAAFADADVPYEFRVGLAIAYVTLPLIVPLALQRRRRASLAGVRNPITPALPAIAELH